MSSVKITTQAPSNIALIKYMGKENAGVNLPSNGSLSMTLNGLQTIAEVSCSYGSQPPTARWVPELPRICALNSPSGFNVPNLSQSGTDRIIAHILRVQKEAWEILDQFQISGQAIGELELRTANNFPAATGIASSASSFAAITLAVVSAMAKDAAGFGEIFRKNADLKRSIARLSRKGSGSSCRSFEGPWVLWESEGAAALRTPQMPEMSDLVLVIGEEAKKVSSSQAHAQVMTSPLWEGRTERVQERLQNLEVALAEADLKTISQISWAEMWEMHSLFHTCAEPFTYWEPGTIEALKWLGTLSDRPIATMDAGANVHLIVETSQVQQWKQKLQMQFQRFKILEDRQGQGAEILEVI